MKGSELSPQDSSRLRVEVLYEALLVQHKYDTQYVQYKAMQDIRESLEIVDQMQTPRYVSRFKPLLYVPAFTQKDFYYVHTGPPTQETSTEELQLYTWST